MPDTTDRSESGEARQADDPVEAQKLVNERKDHLGKPVAPTREERREDRRREEERGESP